MTFEIIGMFATKHAVIDKTKGNAMLKPLIFILSIMLIVFSLTLIGGGASWSFSISKGAELDQNIRAAIFWAGAFISLFGLAGLLAGLVGLIAAAILNAAEREQTEIQASQPEE
jgi:predicted ABC-type sugar transport system permease subunit